MVLVLETTSSVHDKIKMNQARQISIISHNQEKSADRETDVMGVYVIYNACFFGVLFGEKMNKLKLYVFSKFSKCMKWLKVQVNMAP